MRKAIAVSGAESLSDEVRRDLVESVFADTQSMVLGAFMTIVNGLVIAVVAHSWPAVGASAMIALVVVARIRLKWIYQSRTRGNAFTDVRWLERHYVVGMIAYLLAVGWLAVAAFVASDDAFVLTLAVSCAMTHALGIAVRNFAIRTGVGLQLSAVVDVSSVRDLYGTVMSEGATKGVLVTTSSFGPDAHRFAKDKPITLMDGNNLLFLLAKHGHQARIDLAEAKKLGTPLRR